MAGLNAPELVCGGLMSVLDEVWGFSFAEFVAPIDGMAVLADDEQVLLSSDIDSARSHIHLELQTKFDWTRRLPWLLIGAAHVDEATATH